MIKCLFVVFMVTSQVFAEEAKDPNVEAHKDLLKGGWRPMAPDKGWVPAHQMGDLPESMADIKKMESQNAPPPAETDSEHMQGSFNSEVTSAVEPDLKEQEKFQGQFQAQDTTDIDPSQKEHHQPNLENPYGEQRSMANQQEEQQSPPPPPQQDQVDDLFLEDGPPAVEANSVPSESPSTAAPSPPDHSQGGVANSEPAVDPNESLFNVLTKPFLYSREGLRDPFTPFEATLETGPMQQLGLFGPFLELQEINLDQVTIKGILLDPVKPKVLISYPGPKAPILRKVSLQDYLGENFGIVSSIRDGQVIVVQTLEEGDQKSTTTRTLSIRK